MCKFGIGFFSNIVIFEVHPCFCPGFIKKSKMTQQKCNHLKISIKFIKKYQNISNCYHTSTNSCHSIYFSTHLWFNTHLWINVSKDSAPIYGKSCNSADMVWSFSVSDGFCDWLRKIYTNNSMGKTKIKATYANLNHLITPHL